MLGDKDYVVVPGPFAAAELGEALNAIAKADAEAGPDEVKVAATSIRMNSILDRAPIVAALFTHEPLLRTASAIIGAPYRLSGFHLRTVLPGAGAQALHQDVAPGQDGWPLVGFIFMVDAFSPENGATRFVPGSHGVESIPPDLREKHPAEEVACGPAGSMILFNGSAWHGFGANRTLKPRRSIYGALIPSGAVPARDYEKSLAPAVWSQLAAPARRILSGTAVGATG
jgi:ectoine hydroxylase-related dioxygenase (phytanoyl-CoA dioxygenase family)